MGFRVFTSVSAWVCSRSRANRTEILRATCAFGQAYAI